MVANINMRDVICEKYRVFSVKEGGMGYVYLCEDIETGEKCALKTYKKDIGNAQLKSAFIEESSAWVDIGEGDYILTPEDIVYEFGTPFIKMPFCGNGSLREKIEKREINEADALKILVEICIGMWRIGGVEEFIHQDLKPENILFNDDGEAVITDLGIAKSYKKVDKSKAQSTGGTLPYMSPEQIFDQKVDVRAEVIPPEISGS